MKDIVNLAGFYEYLKELEGTGFYGKLMVSFQNGKITNAKLEASLNLDQWRTNEES